MYQQATDFTSNENENPVPSAHAAWKFEWGGPCYLPVFAVGAGGRALKPGKLPLPTLEMQEEWSPPTSRWSFEENPSVLDEPSYGFDVGQTSSA